jgi:hypothetical protein
MIQNTKLIPWFLICCLLAVCPFVSAEIIQKKMGQDIKKIQVFGESWQPDGFVEGSVILSTYIENPDVVIDGKELEDSWTKAVEVPVDVSFGSVTDASVKSIYTDRDVYIRVRWQDRTENREHKPWVWNSKSGSYVQGSEEEDSIILSFEAGCEWFPSFLAGYDYDFDAWQWLAARSDPLGQALDLSGSVKDAKLPNSVAYQSRHTDAVWNLKFIDENDDRFHKLWYELDRQYMLWSTIDTVYYLERMDGRSAVQFAEPLPAPEAAPDDPTLHFPSARPIELSGNAGEVSAKGHWQNGYWTVEFRRKLLSEGGASWDAQFDRLSQFSIHLFDSTSRIDQSSESGALYLQFLPKE